MALELVSITRRFGAQVALDRVSITLERGDGYGFVGHNGAGKTTLMRIALGLQRADDGRVVVDGIDAASHPRDVRARMGGLIETPGFQGAWSGRRNLTALARLQGMDRNAARAEAGRCFERVGLAHAAEKPVLAYSQGMRQRLGIAQALLGSPPYVLLDEPLNGLDPEGIAEMRALVLELVRTGDTGVLVSSHQLSELSEIATKIGVLRHGRLVANGTTRDLLGAGASRYRLDAGDLALARATLRASGVEMRDEIRGPASALYFDLAGRAPGDIARALVQSGVAITGFAPAPASLEEIYLRYAEDRPAPDVARAVDAQSEPVRSTRATHAVTDSRPAPRAAIRRMARFDLSRFASATGLLLVFTAPAIVGGIAMVRRALEAKGDRSEVEAQTLFSATSVNAFEGVGIALQAGLPILAFALLGLGSQSIAAELGRGTLRNVLLRPLTRLDAALGKCAALLAVGAIGYALLVASAFAVAAALFDFGDVKEVLPNGAAFVLTKASDLWPELWLALACPLTPLLAFAAIGFACGSLLRTGAAALATALGLGVVLDLSRALLRAAGARGFSPSDHLPSPLSDTSFVRYYVDVSQGVSNATFESALKSVLVPLAWAVVCFLVAERALARRSVP